MHKSMYICKHVCNVHSSVCLCEQRSCSGVCSSLHVVYIVYAYPCMYANYGLCNSVCVHAHVYRLTGQHCVSGFSALHVIMSLNNKCSNYHLHSNVSEP